MSRASKRPKIDPQTSKHSLISGQFMKSSIDNDNEVMLNDIFLFFNRWSKFLSFSEWMCLVHHQFRMPMNRWFLILCQLSMIIMNDEQLRIMFLQVFIRCYAWSTQPIGNHHFHIFNRFEVIFVVLRSNLTSPKWKNFSGSRIQCQDKIRLNNAIWRIWHQQCETARTCWWFESLVFFWLDIKNKKIVACRFVSLTNVHTLPVERRWISIFDQFERFSLI